MVENESVLILIAALSCHGGDNEGVCITQLKNHSKLTKIITAAPSRPAFSHLFRKTMLQSSYDIETVLS